MGLGAKFANFFGSRFRLEINDQVVVMGVLMFGGVPFCFIISSPASLLFVQS